jgi:NAD(P)-dependent dehydrogenase (short-subunit alcohol dehydrogenase family)
MISQFMYVSDIHFGCRRTIIPRSRKNGCSFDRGRIAFVASSLTKPEIDVRGLRVLITAGGSGIGCTIAECFAACGAKVHVTDVAEATLATANGDVRGLTGTVGDASDENDVDRTFGDVSATLGGLDVLVNNAGIAGPTGVVDTLRAPDIDRTIDVNLKSQFYFLNRFVPFLKASKRNPSIIAMGSVAGRLGYGKRGATPDLCRIARPNRPRSAALSAAAKRAGRAEVVDDTV